ncbi:hypothetical protein SAMN05216593_101305 [Pseudomonas asturiensis]|uniref:Uncharacterized protein n=1 Tax=Pseudomonas asturiensis TaxID=1190415 RepID=A0A1M7JG36_9PSED|nr:hypothetical protein [Pseudomonas asturiensis]SHM51743.1 hypothetical protein SAMN05216593_101305 [Pseudomonas asturiensis]
MSAQIDPYRLPALPHYLSGLVFADRATPQQPQPLYTLVGHYNAVLEWLSLDDFIDTGKTEGITTEGFNAFWMITLAGDVQDDVACNTAPDGARETVAFRLPLT